MKNKINVLVVDDSALVRELFRSELSKDPHIHVMDVASDPFVAREKILLAKPDVITLDIEMPRMDGVEFLKRLMPNLPIPVIVVSSLTEKGGALTIDALSNGAIDFITKPTSRLNSRLNDVISELKTKIKLASCVDVSGWKNKKPNTIGANEVKRKSLIKSTDKVIAIGASTGGTEALARLLALLPIEIPGIVVVQHMPPNFTKSFAQRLNRDTAFRVTEAVDGDRVTNGCVYIAPGGMQMKIIRSGGIYTIKVFEGERVNGHAPSVGVLFDSVAEYVGANALGIILTGMGKDGAEGMKKMHDQGAYNIGQNAESCVVYGMPKAAFDLGGVDRELSIEQMPNVILDHLEKVKV